MNTAELESIAEALAAPGKGLLASDESTGTIGKRLDKVGLENTEENRRAYRELFYTAKGMGQHISGAIMYKETLYQSAEDGRSFVECLHGEGMVPGIKVDEGLTPIEGCEAETCTRGLDNLAKNLPGWHAQGARFAKWRAALKVTEACPSERAVQLNAEQLAAYAGACQAHGLVPVVEPEILIDGDHSMQRFGEASTRVLAACVAKLWAQGVHLEACLLKPQMVLPGAGFAGPRPAPSEVAAATLTAMRRTVPAAIPGIMFLSGGQTEEEATNHLNHINRLAQQQGRTPWSLSFSFGRALQASVLRIWSADRSRRDEAQRMALALAAANGAAARGAYEGPHPSILSDTASLHESFRGWSGAAGP